MNYGYGKKSTQTKFLREHVKKTLFTFLADAKALNPPPPLELLADDFFLVFFHVKIYIYVLKYIREA